MLNRRDALAAAMVLGCAPLARAQAWPSRPVRVIVPYTPGGATDIYARVIAKNLGDIFKVPFVVDNRPGGDTMIGAQAAATAPPDGHTLLYTVAATMSTNQFLYKRVAYKPEDFAPVSLTGTSRYTLTINADLPVKNLQEFVRYVKERPGKVAMATLGKSSGGYMVGKLFTRHYGLDMIDVPYKGSSEANTALMSGTVALYPDGISGVLPLHKAGKVRIIAVTSKTRSPELPDVPTMVEQGFADFVVGNWFALFAPAGTPADTIQKLNAAMVRVVSGEEFNGKLVANGIVPESSTPGELAALMRETIELSRKNLAAVNIEPQ